LRVSNVNLFFRREIPHFIMGLAPGIKIKEGSSQKLLTKSNKKKEPSLHMMSNPSSPQKTNKLLINHQRRSSFFNIQKSGLPPVSKFMLYI
jgi:hypothetical protein